MATTQAAAAPRSVVEYVRVSTDKQAGHGVSLEAQAERIRAMATVHDLTLSDILIDAGASAASLKRPALAELLALVDAGKVATVIIAKLDRLTRSVRDLADLLERFERRGVALVSVGESLDTRSAAGRLVLNVMMSVAQWEREAIGERTRDAMRHKKAAGQRVGTVPFGWQLAADGRALEANVAEQEVLSVIGECRAAGFTLRAIAAELNRQGISTRCGGPWRHQYVAGVLPAAA
jgi:site-specific DNA recombinase